MSVEKQLENLQKNLLPMDQGKLTFASKKFKLLSNMQKTDLNKKQKKQRIALAKLLEQLNQIADQVTPLLNIESLSAVVTKPQRNTINTLARQLNIIADFSITEMAGPKNKIAGILERAETFLQQQVEQRKTLLLEIYLTQLALCVHDDNNKDNPAVKQRLFALQELSNHPRLKSFVPKFQNDEVTIASVLRSLKSEKEGNNNPTDAPSLILTSKRIPCSDCIRLPLIIGIVAGAALAFIGADKKVAIALLAKTSLWKSALVIGLLHIPAVSLTIIGLGVLAVAAAGLYHLTNRVEYSQQEVKTTNSNTP
jgi:hypothetical protein